MNGDVFFPTVAGVRVALRDQEGEDGTARFVPSAVREPPPGFEDVIVVERAAERELMAKILDVEDVDKAWTAAAALHETRKRLPPLSYDLIEGCVVEHSVRLGKAALRLGLPRVDPDQATLTLRVGFDGLLVETLSEQLVPCHGVLSGEGVVAKDLRSARVDDRLRLSLAREASVLWTKAINELDTTQSSDDRQVLRAWLRHGALRYVGDDVGEMPGWLVALRARLLDARVFPLDGGFISLNTAVQEQPPALARR